MNGEGGEGGEPFSRSILRHAQEDGEKGVQEEGRKECGMVGIDFKSLTSNQRLVLNILIPSLYLLPLVVAWFSPKHFGFGVSWLVPLGLMTGLLGVGLWSLGMWNLGRGLAVLPGADTLVTRGVYKYIRHPIYIGIEMTLFGLLLACGSWFGMIYWAGVILPVNRVRAREEEKALLDQFGDRYRDYQRRTWF